jgi:hypothetical protein
MSQCVCITGKGTRCTFNAKPGSKYCGVHLSKGCKSDFAESKTPVIESEYTLGTDDSTSDISYTDVVEKSNYPEYSERELVGQPPIVFKEIIRNLQNDDIKKLCNTSKKVKSMCNNLDNKFWQDKIDAECLFTKVPKNMSPFEHYIKCDPQYTTAFNSGTDTDKIRIIFRQLLKYYKYQKIPTFIKKEFPGITKLKLPKIENDPNNPIIRFGDEFERNLYWNFRGQSLDLAKKYIEFLKSNYPLFYDFYLATTRDWGMVPIFEQNDTSIKHQINRINKLFDDLDKYATSLMK